MIQPRLLTPQDATLVEAVFRRMSAFALDAPLGADPQEQVRLMRQAWQECPDRLLLIAFQDEAGRLVGHGAALLDGTAIILHQGQLDGPADRAFGHALALADQWGQPRGARYMLMGATKHPRAWARRYGFQFFRYLMGRPVGAPIPALTRHA